MWSLSLWQFYCHVSFSNNSPAQCQQIWWNQLDNLKWTCVHNRRDRGCLMKSVVGQDEHLPIQWQYNMAKFDHRHSPTSLGRPALLSRRRLAMPSYYHQIGLPSILCQRLNRQLYPRRRQTMRKKISDRFDTKKWSKQIPDVHKWCRTQWSMKCQQRTVVGKLTNWWSLVLHTSPTMHHNWMSCRASTAANM